MFVLRFRCNVNIADMFALSCTLLMLLTLDTVLSVRRPGIDWVYNNRISFVFSHVMKEPDEQ